MKDKHTHTDQEQALWDHMEAGEWDAIEQARLETEDLVQFEEDEFEAWTHYQDAHEMPAKDREKNTKDDADRGNQRARDRDKPPKPEHAES